MPTRFTPALCVLLASAVVASAEPLPASYYVRVSAPDGYNGVLLGTVLEPPIDGDPARPYFHYWDTGMGNYGMVRIDVSTPTETQQLFGFWPYTNQWVMASTLPTDKRLSPGLFQLSWGFTPWGDGSGQVVGTTTGTLTTGGPGMDYGAYVIGLDHTESLSLNGEAVEVRFRGVNQGYYAVIEMTVTPNAPEVPEPGTLIIGGIALVGGLGAWVRKRRM